MIRTKVQADAHVSNVLKKLTTKQEKLQRGFQFAKIYYDVNDFVKAEEYILGFLSVKDNYPPAYKLLGQIREATDPKKAVTAYKKSFDLDPSQKDVLLKVCQLMDKCDVDADQAKYWSEKAEKFFPSNETIFNLKAKAKEGQLENSSNSNNADELINFYESECVKFPKDLTRLMKLLKLYKSNGKVEEAFQKIMETKTLHHSLEWYRCVIEVLSEYKKSKADEKLPIAFLQSYLMALNHLASLTIEQSLSLSSASEALWRLDQELVQYTEQSAASSFVASEGSFQVLVSEIGAQYVYLCGVLLLNKAQKEDLNWRTASDLSYACFLASQSQSPPDMQESWFKRASCDEKKFFERLYEHACLRCSQTGHILRKKYDDESNGSKWLSRIQEEYLHPAGIKRICQILFPLYGNAHQETFIFRSSLFSSTANVPDMRSLNEWDGVVQLADPGNLATLVWICLHYYSRVEDIQPEYPFVLFPGLPYGSRELNSSNLESLSQLDVQGFLTAAVRCSALVHRDRFERQDPSRPFLLPLRINESLCSKLQIEWWSALNQYYNSSLSIDRVGQTRSVLLHGLEVVRLIGNHGMDVKLVVHLARNWVHKIDQRPHESDSELEIYERDTFLEKVAKHYWSKAKEMIEKLLNKQSLPYPKICLFESRTAPSHVSETIFKKYLNEGKLFLSFLMKNSDRDNALKMLNSVKSADSLYQTGLIYKEMAADNNGSLLDDTLGENRKEEINFLTKAKHAFKDALEMGADDDSTPSEEITKELKQVEAKLSHLQVARESQYADDTMPSFFLTTPQKKSSGDREKTDGYMVSSTPFNKPNCGAAVQTTPKSNTTSHQNVEEFKAQLASLTHYVDQRFKLVSDENQRLLEKIIALEHKVGGLESQKLTWTPTIPLHLQGQMVPATHPGLAHFQQLPVLQGNQMKPISDMEFANRIHPPVAMDKFNPSIHPNVAALHQRVVAPGFNSMPQLVNFPQRPVLKNPTDQMASLAEIFYPADRENVQDLPENTVFRGFESMEAMLPAIQPGFFSQHHIPATTAAAVSLSCTVAAVPAASSSPQRGTTSLAKLLEGNILTVGPTSKKDLQELPAKAVSVARGSGISTQVVTLDTSSLSKTSFGKASQPAATPQCVNSTGKKLSDAAPKKVIITKNKTTPTPQTSSSLFSNFTFGLPASNSAATKPEFRFPPAFAPSVDTQQKSSATEIKAKSVAKSPVKQDLNLSTENGDNKQDESVEEFEPSGDFKPLVSLPIVNVVTGEEDEVKLFGERGKLYRMDPDVKQWKERGSGEVKILQNDASNKFRIIMRRDQVHKVCANHYITKDMKLESMDSAENSFCWFAQDFAEEEPKKENFCLKFKTKEIAIAFKDCFNLCQKKLATNETGEVQKSDKLPSGSTRTVEVKPPGTPSQKVEDSKSKLSDMFKPKEGEWECKDCYVRNLPASLSCVSCQGPKPGTEKASVSSQPKDPKMVFGPQGGFQFNLKTDSTSGTSGAGMFSSTTAGFVPSSTLNTGSWSSLFGTSGTTASTVSEQSKNDKSMPIVKFESSKSQNVEAEKTKPNLSEMFKSKEGEWECNDCYVRNPSASIKCASCECPKPGAPKVSEISQPPKDPKITFPPQGGFQFNRKIESTSMASSAPTTAVGFNFGGAPVPSSTRNAGSWSSPFATSASTNVFADAAGLATSTSITSNNFSISALFSASSTPSIFNLTTASATASNAPVSIPAKLGFPPASSTGSFCFPKPVFTLSSSVNSSPLFSSSKPLLFSFNKSSEAADKSSNTSTSTTFTTLSSISFSKTKFEETGKNVVASFGTPEKKVGASSAGVSHSFGTPTFTFAGISNKINLSNIDVKTPTSVSMAPQSPQSPDDEMYANVEGEDDHIRFEPVVKLPDNFDLVTGEESETVLFCEDAKMYRFVKDEWKEKGFGKVKLLKNPAGKVRVLMRREKVHKICCNHFVLANMQLQAMPSAKNKAWIWYANDFSEGDGSYEQLCIKFKTEEQATSFKKVFEDSVKDIKTGSTVTDSKKEDSEEDCVIIHAELPSPNHISEANRYSLPDSFYNYLNAPSCPGCIGCDEDKFVFSSVDLQQGSLVKKEGAKVKNESEFDLIQSSSTSSILPSFGTTLSFPTPSTSSISFSWPSSLGFSVFQSSVTPSSATSASTKAIAPASEPTSGTTKVFGSSLPTTFGISLPSTQTVNVSKKPEPSEKPSAAESKAPESKTLFSSNVFGFGSTSGAATFASTASSSTTSGFINVTPTVDNRKHAPAGSQTTTDTTPNVFGSSSKYVDFTTISSSGGGGFKKDTRFSWQGTGQQLFSSPVVTSPQSGAKESGKDDDDDEVEPSLADDIHFEPVVTLPVVDTKTGEEDEDELYKQRSKLYRFDGGEWKERGVGEMKILKSKTTGSCRLLFRRDQVHKVVCNHLLTTDINFEPMNTSEKAWCWFASDFSDGEARMEQFAINFKTPELAKEFKMAVDKCKSDLAVKPVVVKDEVDVYLHPEGHIQEYEEEVEDGKYETADGYSSFVFEKRATLLYKDPDNNIGTVTVIIEEDSDVSGYRVTMSTDDGETVCNHIICTGYHLERPTDQKKNVHSCSWTAKDYSTDEPVRKTFILKFSSESSLDEFVGHFNEGTRLATEQELTENRQDEYEFGQSSDDEED